MSAKVREHLAKIVASSAFESSVRLQELLRYTVSHALDGRTDELEASVLGVEVFGRTAGYELASCAVVRGDFSRLLKKLEKYYREEGFREPLRIRYVKGSYIPEFLSSEAKPEFAGSVVVLPLAFTGSGDDEAFADGLTDELITALSRVPGLK